MGVSCIHHAICRDVAVGLCICIAELQAELEASRVHVGTEPQRLGRSQISETFGARPRRETSVPVRVLRLALRLAQASFDSRRRAQFRRSVLPDLLPSFAVCVR